MDLKQKKEQIFHSERETKFKIVLYKKKTSEFNENLSKTTEILEKFEKEFEKVTIFLKF